MNKLILSLLLLSGLAQADEFFPVSLRGHLGNAVTLQRMDTKEIINGFLLPYDLPRTPESGSCIASGDLLVKQKLTFYCWNRDMGTMEKLSWNEH